MRERYEEELQKISHGMIVYLVISTVIVLLGTLLCRLGHLFSESMDYYHGYNIMVVILASIAVIMILWNQIVAQPVKTSYLHCFYINRTILIRTRMRVTMHYALFVGFLFALLQIEAFRLQQVLQIRSGIDNLFLFFVVHMLIYSMFIYTFTVIYLALEGVSDRLSGIFIVVSCAFILQKIIIAGMKSSILFNRPLVACLLCLGLILVGSVFSVVYYKIGKESDIR